MLPWCQAANERLEAALVESTRAAAAGGPPAQPSAASSDVDAVGQLSAELAVSTGKLQAAEERVAQVEKLLKVRSCTVDGICKQVANHNALLLLLDRTAQSEHFSPNNAAGC